MACWPARSLWRHRPAAAGSGVRRRIDAARARRRQRRSPVLDVSSRPSRASVARVFAMAFVVAVARGRGFGGDLCSERRVRHRLGRVGTHDRALGGERSLELPLRCSHGNLHRLHLPLAETHSGVVQRLGRAELFVALGDDGRAMARRARRRCSAIELPGLGPLGLRRRSCWRWCSSLPTGGSSTQSGSQHRRKAPPASAFSAKCGCSRRRTHRKIICSRKWASVSRASMRKNCESSRCALDFSAVRAGDRRRFGVGRYRADLLAVRGGIAIPGVLVERWLFFAEAKHTVTLYYGREL